MKNLRELLPLKPVGKDKKESGFSSKLQEIREDIQVVAIQVVAVALAAGAYYYGGGHDWMTEKCDRGELPGCFDVEAIKRDFPACSDLGAIKRGFPEYSDLGNKEGHYFTGVGGDLDSEPESIAEGGGGFGE
jgi:hypothetical protein